MKISILILLVTFKLLAQPVVIDAGSPTDTGFSSPAGFTSTAYTIPDPVPTSIADSTMRYGQQFTYHLNLGNKPGMYALVLSFVEPTVQLPGQRIFSVWANDQPIIQNLDLFAEAGYLIPTQRAVVVYCAGTDFFITFSASVRNAVISSITLQGLGFGSGLTWQTDTFPTVTLALNMTVSSPGMAGATVVTGGQIFPLTYAPSPAGAVFIFRNGLYQRAGLDYTISPSPSGGTGLQFLTPIAVGDNISAIYQH